MRASDPPLCNRRSPALCGASSWPLLLPPFLEPLGVVLEDKSFEQVSRDGAFFLGQLAHRLELALQVVGDGGFGGIEHRKPGAGAVSMAGFPMGWTSSWVPRAAGCG